MAKVFISYSHDSEEHKRSVNSIALMLRGHGLDVVIDQDVASAAAQNETWALWAETHLTDADYVLVACTEIYYRRYLRREQTSTGEGVQWEAHLIRNILYQTAKRNQQVLVILFDSSYSAYVPLSLQGLQQFHVYLSEGRNELVTWLTGQTPPAPRSHINWPAPITYEWDMANRKRITGRIEAMLADLRPKPQPILLLSGDSNLGKSYILNAVTGYARKLSLAHSMLTFKGGVEFDDLTPKILREITGKEIGEPSRSLAVRELQEFPAPFLLIFDSYEQAAPESQEWLENQFLPGLASNAAVVIAGQKIPDRSKYHPLWHAEHIAIEPIGEAKEWFDYSCRKWRSPRLNFHHVESLTFATNGSPGALYPLLENLVKQLSAAAGA